MVRSLPILRDGSLGAQIKTPAPPADEEDFLRPSALYAALLCGWTDEGQAADILIDAGAQLNPKSASITKRSRFVPLAGAVCARCDGSSHALESLTCTCAAACRRLAPRIVARMLDMGADPTIGSQSEECVGRDVPVGQWLSDT